MLEIDEVVMNGTKYKAVDDDDSEEEFCSVCAFFRNGCELVACQEHHRDDGRSVYFVKC